jgi:hypothetical protein
MLDIDAVEAAIKSDAVLKALSDLIGAENMMKSAADTEKYVARQVAESEEKTKRALRAWADHYYREDDVTEYAYYRRELRTMGHSPAGLMPYFCGDGGDADWTEQRVHYKGERWLERTKHGYMPAEAVEEMRELRAVFDRGGWWTVLAWVAACPQDFVEGLADALFDW